MYRYTGGVDEKLIARAWDAYLRYRSDKEQLCMRVRQNMQMYRAAYAQLYDEQTNRTIPKTAYILAAVENKYADYIDNFPEPNFLAREADDEQTAGMLSKIVPVQLEMADFKAAYKRCVRQKLICGTGIYGVFYDRRAEEIRIKSIDFMNVFSDMSVCDVQESEFLFISSAASSEQMRKNYPEAAELFGDEVTVKGYDGDRVRYGCCEIIDCYYKKDGAVHLIKFCEGCVIYASQDKLKEGIYAHGMYPVIYDVMYPDADCPFGFGMVDTTKNPQVYIDMLDGAILKNALLASSPKWFIAKNAGINAKDFADVSKEVIECANIDEEHVRRIELAGMNSAVMEHREKKINELKEVAASRDVSTGGAVGGITAASAITALQEAGDKQSRAIISDSFDAYRKVVKIVVELMRQFFDSDRVFRTVGENGRDEFVTFTKERLIRAESRCDALGFPVGTEYKNAEFDIDIVPQRQNAFRRETNNQTVLALYQNGLFAPENIEVSLVVLSAMQFDGKEKIIADLRAIAERQQAQQPEEVQM